MTPGDSLRRFAGEVVGLEDDREGGGTLAALLRKLVDDDFLPDPLAHEALLALAGRPIESGSLLGEEAFASEERKLHAEVEGFASGFFATPVASRVASWRTLAEACARHPRLLDRLRALKPGLEVDRGAVRDPSPAAQRLLDDLLTLFPLRPEPRAVESRSRLEQFRSDPSTTPADRDRASKRVLRRHPTVAALSPDYLAQLGQPRRSIQAARAPKRAAGTWSRQIGDNRVTYVFLLLTVLGTLGRLANSSKSTDPQSPVPASTPLPSSSRRAINPTPVPSLEPGLANPAAIPQPESKPGLAHFFLRDQVEANVKREIARIGKTIDDEQLTLIVDALPVESLPPASQLAALPPSGSWTKEVRDRYVAQLKGSLGAMKLGLSEPDLDDLARRCFPEPETTEKPAPDRPQSP